MATFIGSAENQDIVLSSSSGGFFSSIVCYVQENISDDAYIVGVVWQEDFKGVRHLCSNKKDDWEKMKTSKYIQSDKGEVLLKVEELLNNDKVVLFTGTPCETAGLKSFLKRQYTNLITIDFICKGPTTPKAQAEYVTHLEKKFKSSVTGINMRYKWKQIDNFIPQFIKVSFKSKHNFIKEFYQTEIGHAFRFMQRPSCYSCKYCENNYVSDITIGDYHGEKRDKAYYNRFGTSIIMPRTAMGKKIVQDMIDQHYFVGYEVEGKEALEKNTGDRISLTIRENYVVEMVRTGSVIAARRLIPFKEKIKLVLPKWVSRKLFYAKHMLVEWRR